MKRPSFRQLLGLGVVVLVVAVGVVAGLLGSSWGRRQIERQVRERLAQNSDLVLAPFQVDFSLLRDFPHLTASLHHMQLTDTAYRHSVPVLRIGRADLRLTVSQLLWGRVQIDHITVEDAEFRQYTDGQGRDWGLHGRGPRKATPTIPPDFDLASLTVRNLHVTDRNDLHHSGYAAHVAQAQLVARTRNGVARCEARCGGSCNFYEVGEATCLSRSPCGRKYGTPTTLGSAKVRFNGPERRSMATRS
ncbi:AsmA family protein [Hymenobacter sp. AT01-02]|uniref:AsmA family protein n=1 Tax=Hymenobacter sp. AT01-02 TaxID=1571877 RepID=UPI0005F1FDF4|nr:AsmA family protein [Hymenobacter sp. AT01-02]